MLPCDSGYTMPRDARICACARACVCEHVRVRVISEIKHPFQDNANSLVMRTLYTHQIISFFIMWDYVFYVFVRN